ncbi:alpha-galactosidase [Streptococcus suis]|uniref:alpha-galactosidase n=1 Tax=Streptococcus suis TaxID=1307 RepID=UPI000CF67BCD|nr:alpha-galactosidase [Streptococcus suis]
MKNIVFDVKTKQFHLYNEKISYVMQVEQGGVLSHIYFGKRIQFIGDSNWYPRLERGYAPHLPRTNESIFSKDTLPQEYSSAGAGDYRVSALELVSDKGAMISDFRYRSYRIFPGVKKIKGLPQSKVQQKEEALTLEIILYDTVLDVEIQLNYTIFDKDAVIARSACVKNCSERRIRLQNFASFQLDLLAEDYELITLPGKHAGERMICRNSITQGVHRIESRRVASSHQMNPYICLLEPHTDEEVGKAYGFHLIYSGNFQMTVEKDQFEQLRILAGINDYNFNWLLEANETFFSPEVLLSYSDTGLNGLSQTHHDFINSRIIRQDFKNKERPILINNWEATYFDFTSEQLEKLIDEASDLGIEMFVLDDGWFGHRDSDNSSLGDWVEYKGKLSKGLKSLSEYVHKKGMKFGMWFEPEAISKDSELYRNHPDFLLEAPNRPAYPSRRQYQLDFSRQDVRENIFNQMCQVIDNLQLDYIKWDMCRHVSDVYSNAQDAEKQGEVSHRYVLGLYDFMDKLQTRYPEMLMEGCAGGGGRFDLGILSYMPQIWTSDNTDSIARVKIQYGTSLAYPVSSFTGHVSASPNHQTGRESSLRFRSDVAMSCVFGYELDVSKLSEVEKLEIRSTILFYKRHRKLIQFGDFYRLISPFHNNTSAIMFVNPEKTEFLLFTFYSVIEAQPPIKRMRLRGLDSDKIYKEMDTGKLYMGSELIEMGLLYFPKMKGDGQSTVQYFKEYLLNDEGREKDGVD